MGRRVIVYLGVALVLAPAGARAQDPSPIDCEAVLTMDLEALSAEELEALRARLAVEESLRWNQLPNTDFAAPVVTMVLGALAVLGGVLTATLSGGYGSETMLVVGAIVGPVGGVALTTGGIWYLEWRQQNRASAAFLGLGVARRALGHVAREQALRAPRRRPGSPWY